MRTVDTVVGGLEFKLINFSKGDKMTIEHELKIELKELISEEDAEKILTTNPSLETLSVTVECLRKKAYDDLNSEWTARTGTV